MLGGGNERRPIAKSMLFYQTSSVLRDLSREAGKFVLGGLF